MKRKKQGNSIRKIWKLLGENKNICTHSYECVRDFNPNYIFFLIEYILVYYYDVNDKQIYSYLEVILYGLY